MLCLILKLRFLRANRVSQSSSFLCVSSGCGRSWISTVSYTLLHLIRFLFLLCLLNFVLLTNCTISLDYSQLFIVPFQYWPGEYQILQASNPLSQYLTESIEIRFDRNYRHAHVQIYIVLYNKSY